MSMNRCYLLKLRKKYLIESNAIIRIGLLVVFVSCANNAKLYRQFSRLSTLMLVGVELSRFVLTWDIVRNIAGL